MELHNQTPSARGIVAVIVRDVLSIHSAPMPFAQRYPTPAPPPILSRPGSPGFAPPRSPTRSRIDFRRATAHLPRFPDAPERQPTRAPIAGRPPNSAKLDQARPSQF